MGQIARCVSQPCRYPIENTASICRALALAVHISQLPVPVTGVLSLACGATNWGIREEILGSRFNYYAVGGMRCRHYKALAGFAEDQVFNREGHCAVQQRAKSSGFAAAFYPWLDSECTAIGKRDRGRLAAREHPVAFQSEQREVHQS